MTLSVKRQLLILLNMNYVITIFIYKEKDINTKIKISSYSVRKQVPRDFVQQLKAMRIELGTSINAQTVV